MEHLLKRSYLSTNVRIAPPLAGQDVFGGITGSKVVYFETLCILGITHVVVVVCSFQN